MKRVFLYILLFALALDAHAQDLNQDIENGTIPADIARVIDESWVLMQSAEDTEARGALAVSMLPMFRQYHVNTRAHFKTLFAAAEYYYDIQDYESAANCMDEFFHRLSNSDMTLQKLGLPESLNAYRLYAQSLHSVYEYEGAISVCKNGLMLSHAMGDSLEYHVIEFSSMLSEMYGAPWSPMKDETLYHQYKDTCLKYLSLQDFSRPGMLQYVTTNAYMLSSICYARQEMDEAFSIMSPYMATFDVEHATVEDLGLLNGWVYNCSFVGRYDEVRKYAPITLTLHAAEMNEMYSAFSENDRQKVSEEYDIFFESILSSAMNSDCSAIHGDIYNHLLYRKNLLLRTSRNVEDAVKKSQDPRIRLLYADYKFSLVKRNIEKDAKHPNEVLLDSLERRINMIDRMLTFYAHQNKLEESVPTWKDIQNRLTQKSVAVEYYHFDHIENQKWDDKWYVAVLITKSCESPIFIPLFPRNDLPDRTFGSGYQQKVFGNLEKYIYPGDTIYFSPHGALHSMSMETMFLPDKSVVCDKYIPIRLTSTAHLISSSRVYDRTATLYGGLSYNLTEKTMRTEAMLASRTRAGVDPLPYTKKEIENIGANLKKKGYKVALLSGSKGNEESFKALSGASPAIIHLATHGFYKDTYDDDERDPLLRAGLLMSGANAKALIGGSEDYDDGVLTAREVSSLDLRGTDLVVLSACETGMGDINSDGVWGLQRAFKMAGAGTLILSLWEVEEAPTEQFMTAFYREYLNHNNKVDAFRKAQDVIRKAYPEDFHWAAFVMLD